MINNDCMSIVYITDNNYVGYTLSSIKSVLLTAKKPIKIYVICDKVDEVNKQKLSICDNIILIDYTNENVSLYGKYRYVSSSSFLKFDIPNIINEKKCLYIDGDTIAVGDITSIFDYDISNYFAAVMKDFGRTYIWKSKSNGDKFYSGTMLLNLEKMREHNITEQLHSFKSIHQDTEVWNDMEIFNVVLAGKVLFIPIKYCVSLEKIRNSSKCEYRNIELYNKLYGTYYQNIDELISDAVIFHFHGDKKKIYSTPVLKQILKGVNERFENKLKEEGKKMTETDINWRKYFDRIFCIHYLPNISIMSRLQEELKRVGILQCGIFEWKFTVPCVYDEVIMHARPNKEHMKKIGWVNESLALLDILKQSQILGYNRILVVEDDATFLLNLHEIQQSLDMLPSGYDVVQFDHGFSKVEKIGKKQKEDWEKCLKENKINDRYIDTTGYWIPLGTGNVYSAKGIEECIKVLENRPIAMDTLSIYTKAKRAVAVKNVCVQVVTKCSITGSKIGTKFNEIYKAADLDYEDYNWPNGYFENGGIYLPDESKQKDFLIHQCDSITDDDKSCSKVWIFSNVYHFSTPEQARATVLSLGIKPTDFVIFLNKAIWAHNVIEVLPYCKIISLHRFNRNQGGWFGITEMDRLCKSSGRDIQIKELDNYGNVFSYEGKYEGTISVSDYPEGMIPTTGFFAVLYAKQIGFSDIQLVNFYGTSDKSTPHYKSHEWGYEEEYLSQEKHISLEPKREKVHAISDDGFGYVMCTPPVRKPRLQQQTPTITTRSSVTVLPRIGSRKRGYSNW